MRIRMMSAALVLVLLFLPSENGSPLELPRGAAPQFALVPAPTWELWPRRPGLGAKPPLPSVGTEAGPPSLHRLLGPCEAGGAESTPELRRKERSPYSSRRKDGRPNSLDLTFHLLREFLEMSREERLAQKALSNQLLLQNIGK
ncbi:Corticoliberin [Chelonia mydas]|uniref:Corticoliberin n=1 Tax=Chelonia mydas TaxID=8469 RepID=M7BMQ6_CHEMY|nr:Corticoliberin [Chelonia mydas]